VAEQVRELFLTAAGVAATANAQGRPSITRAWGPTISADGYVVVCLTACAGSAMRANLAAKGRIGLHDVGLARMVGRQKHQVSSARRGPR